MAVATILYDQRKVEHFLRISSLRRQTKYCARGQVAVDILSLAMRNGMRIIDRLDMCWHIRRRGSTIPCWLT